MKILQVIQKRQMRGAEIFACQLSEHLTQKGVTADILYLFDGDISLPDFDLLFIPLQANISRRFWDLSAYKRLAKIVREGNYTIIQANAGDTLKFAVFSRLLFRWDAKIIFRNANLMSAFMRGSLHRAFNRWLLSKCDYVISVSEICRQDMSKVYLKAAVKSVTIPIGTYAFDIQSANSWRAGLEPIFINIGSFVPEKNHEFLIDVFHQYYLKHGKGHLWLVGDGKLHSFLKEKTTQLNLGSRVQFMGYRKDVIDILKSAHILIMPSKIEGLPAVILEALSCQVPVIASNVGGIPEVIINGVNGYCLSNMNIDEYLYCMDKLSKDSGLRSKFVVAGIETIRRQYLMSDVANRFHQTYLQLTEVK
jgi:L-malate glycosyltransferase